MNSTFTDKQPQDVTWEELRAEFDGKCFLPDVRKRKESSKISMIVGKYKATFKALERLTLDLVLTERGRIEQGLRSKKDDSCTGWTG